jgi:hypothetical protein
MKINIAPTPPAIVIGTRACVAKGSRYGSSGSYPSGDRPPRPADEGGQLCWYTYENPNLPFLISAMLISLFTKRVPSIPPKLRKTVQQDS